MEPRENKRLLKALPLPEVRGLNREQASAYIGISVSLFDAMVTAGSMPKPRNAHTRKLWDRHALDKAFDQLPGGEAAVNEAIEQLNPWDGPKTNPWD